MLLPACLLLAFLWSAEAAPHPGVEQCGVEEQQNIALEATEEPAHILRQYTDIRDVQTCYKMCCELVKEGCNVASFVKYEHEYVCINLVCDPVDKCTWGPYPTAMAAKIMLLNETGSQGNASDSAFGSGDGSTDGHFKVITPMGRDIATKPNSNVTHLANTTQVTATPAVTESISVIETLLGIELVTETPPVTETPTLSVTPTPETPTPPGTPTMTPSVTPSSASDEKAKAEELPMADFDDLAKIFEVHSKPSENDPAATIENDVGVMENEQVVDVGVMENEQVVKVSDKTEPNDDGISAEPAEESSFFSSPTDGEWSQPAMVTVGVVSVITALVFLAIIWKWSKSRERNKYRPLKEAILSQGHHD